MARNAHHLLQIANLDLMRNWFGAGGIRYKEQYDAFNSQ